MMIQMQIANINTNVFIGIHRLALPLFLLASSIVIADSTLKLDFSDEFYLQSNETKFSRGNQPYRPDKEEPKWRKPASPSSPSMRWGAKTIYDENNQLEPLLGAEGTGQAAETINLNPQLELRF